MGYNMTLLHPEACKDTILKKRLTDLMAQSQSASLAVIERHKTATPVQILPYVSLVMVAHIDQMVPILLLSDLAHHTKLIKQESKICLLYDGTAGLEVPLTGQRASVYGIISPISEQQYPDIKKTYLATHPDAEQYVSFRDFQFYKVSPYQAHLIAGFGAIHWLDLTD